MLFYKKIREAKKDFAVVDKNKFFRVDFGQGLALNQATAPVNWVPEKKMDNKPPE